MSNQKEAAEYYISQVQECLRVTLDELKEVAGKREV